MVRLFKPSRSKESMRGFFSYISESLFNIYNAIHHYQNEELKIYFDLNELPGYGNGNVFDICFEQDFNDYKDNNYINIESIPSNFHYYPYDGNTFKNVDLSLFELIIKNYFVLNNRTKNLFNERYSQIDFKNTIGFHRRSTDISSIHGVRIIPINDIFLEIEKEDFENIFLMCDNLEDLKKFEDRYGNRLITFDEISAPNSNGSPFFKNNNNDGDILKNHISEIVFGAYTLSLTKKLICTRSNLTNFSILANSKLQYKILN